MAYEEPGVKVIQQLQLEAANVADATQALTIVGELYEVFDDQLHSLHYDPVTGAGVQEFSWPAKKLSSVVDFAGVRKSIAEVDSQLNEFAPYPLQWKLRDPSTSQIFDIDVISDVFAINQTRFKIVEGSGAATARSSDSLATAAKNREYHLAAGGLISAGVVAGDRISVEVDGLARRGTVNVVFDDNVFYTPDGHDFSLNAATIAGATGLTADVSVAGGSVVLPAAGRLSIGSELVDYTSVTPTGDTHVFALAATTPTVFDHAQADVLSIQVLDAASVSEDDGDLVASPGFVSSAAGGLTGKEGSRITLWVDALAVVDGTVAGGDNVVDALSLGLDITKVGQKISIWSEVIADGAVTLITGDVADEGGGLGATFVSTAHVLTANTPFTAAMVGTYIQIGSDYRRIASFTSTTVVVLDSPITAASGLATQVFGQVVRTIMSVNSPSDGNFTVDGVALNAGTALPIVLHRPIYRDLEVDVLNTDFLMRYSGSAVTSDTGFLRQAPWEVFDNDLDQEIFPDYELLCTFRALDLSSTNQELAVFAASDLTALGGVSPANPMAWAGQAALVAMGTSDTLIIMQPVDLFPDDDPGLKSGYPEDQDEVLGYLGALEILSRNEAAYYLVPLTQNSTVRDSFVSHCLAQSAPEEKKERICYLSYKIPLGAVESATGAIDPGLESGNKAILDTGQNFLSLHNIIPGNVVRITAPAAYAADYVVAAGTTEDRLELEGDAWGKDALGVYTAQEFTQVDANFGGQAAAVTSFALSGTTVTAVLAGAGSNVVNESDVGRSVTIASSTTPGNDGAFVIVSVPSDNTVTYENASGATEAGGSATHSVAADGEVGIGTADGWKDVEVGDYLLFGTVTRLITGVISNGVKLYARLQYDGGVLSSGAAQSVSILRSTIAVQYHVNPLSKQGQADALAAIGSARGNRRVVHMWPDTVEMITGTDAFGNDVKENLPSFYAAVAEAGRDSVIPLARSSTGLALGGFTALQHSNFYFSKPQLNTIAGGGWAILEQKVLGAPVVMRHLLTTDVSTVKTQELAFTKNVDNMSKVKRASTEPLLNDENGRINITQQFISALAFPFQGIYEKFVRNGQLVQTADAPPYKILSIRQDTTQPDTILEDTELNVPLPANKVVVTFII